MNVLLSGCSHLTYRKFHIINTQKDNMWNKSDGNKHLYAYNCKKKQNNKTYQPNFVFT